MQKFYVEEVIASNGVSVICKQDAKYHHTEFDDIILAWKEQVKNSKKTKRKFFEKLRKVV